MRADLARLEEREIRNVLRLLRASERRASEVLRARARGKKQTFDRLVALQRKQAVEREIDALEAALKERARGAAANASRALMPRGRPTPILGINVGVSASAIARASQTAANEVRGVTEAVRAKINRAFLRSMTGELDPGELEAEISKAFRGKVTDARLARIVRTELGEISQRDAVERHGRLAAAGVDLIKVWRHKHGGRRMYAGNGRPLFREDHVLVHGQERELSDPFDVGGGATAQTPPGGGLYRAMAPLDPSLPAEQRIHCGCEVVEIPRSEASMPYIASETPSAILQNAGRKAGGARARR